MIILGENLKYVRIFIIIIKKKIGAGNNRIEWYVYADNGRNFELRIFRVLISIRFYSSRLYYKIVVVR